MPHRRRGDPVFLPDLAELGGRSGEQQPAGPPARAFLVGPGRVDPDQLDLAGPRAEQLGDLPELRGEQPAVQAGSRKLSTTALPRRLARVTAWPCWPAGVKPGAG